MLSFQLHPFHNHRSGGGCSVLAQSSTDLVGKTQLDSPGVQFRHQPDDVEEARFFRHRFGRSEETFLPPFRPNPFCFLQSQVKRQLTPRIRRAALVWADPALKDVFPCVRAVQPQLVGELF
jgi:hypothetical protein